MQSDALDAAHESTIVSRNNSDVTCTVRKLTPATSTLQQYLTDEFKCSVNEFNQAKIEFQSRKMIPPSPAGSVASESTPPPPLPPTMTWLPAIVQHEDVKPEVSIILHPPPAPPSSRSTPHQQEMGGKSNESIRNWLQCISQIQEQPQPARSKSSHHQSPSARATSVSSGKVNVASRVVTYDDLPFMGEMTLDNSKPRRGRKPKKADICHLIYKNYGTIFPGAPNMIHQQLADLQAASSMKREPVAAAAATEVATTTSIQRTDVQNRIISSLLEKRLTQECRQRQQQTEPPRDQPLNLCIRDLTRFHIKSRSDVVVKSEPHSDNEDDDVEFVLETAATPDASKSELNAASGSSWPNSGTFLHPLALQQQLMYYQSISNNNNSKSPSRSSPESSTVSSNAAQATPPSSPQQRAPKTPRTSVGAIRTKDTSDIIAAGKRPTPSCASTSASPTKRKRSAIFIPPIPAENQTNPATEVSICKFKFTGGAKPSLQEKKMLSVDAGGNFRYYSGTGDKSMRGYEFFPRETLQQQVVGNAQCSSTGAFLQASGEKVYPAASSADGHLAPRVNEFMLTPEIAPSPLIGAAGHGRDFSADPAASTDASTAARMMCHFNANGAPAATSASANRKQRKSRKSLQREKLERTFKEKGFLIQTQQLESAEGATYCKFRQLRKFTRYLFRSWKDYLPNGSAAPPAVAVDGQLPAIAEEITTGPMIAEGDGMLDVGERRFEVDPEVDNSSKMSRSSHNSDAISPSVTPT